MKKLITFFALIVIVGLHPVRTMAETVNPDRSDMFASACTIPNKLACITYVKAAIDVINVNRIIYKGEDTLSHVIMGCAPSEVTIGQIAEIWLKYIKEHPEQHHLAPIGTLSLSMNAAFPCSK